MLILKINYRTFINSLARVMHYRRMKRGTNLRSQYFYILRAIYRKLSSANDNIYPVKVNDSISYFIF